MHACVAWRSNRTYVPWAVSLGLLLGVLGCAGGKRVDRQDLAHCFGDADGCFVMLSVDTGAVTRVWTPDDPGRCDRRLPPCSTFKIPHALFALECGVTAMDEVFAWDGVMRERWQVNRDQTLCSAISDSVVWVFQELAERLGAERERAWLARCEYGNQDISAGLTTFWLGTSLEISAAEQVRFLNRLRAGRLPIASANVNAVKRCLAQGTGGLPMEYFGKTGSDRARADTGRPDLGWWVGWVAREDGREYVFACNALGDGMFGTRVRPIAERILRELDVLSEVPKRDSARAAARAAHFAMQ